MKGQMNIQATRRRFGSADYLKISIFGAGLSLFWASLHALILPQRVETLVPAASKNAYLGLITFAGLIVAMLVQPFAGALSDRSTLRWGQRRPFILLGTVLGLIVLPGIGISGSFLALFIAYCGLQLSFNIAQAPFQAFIPDMVPENRHGNASGVKSFAEAASVIILLRTMARLMEGQPGNPETWLTGALVWLGALVSVAMLATLFLVREGRPEPRLHPPLGTALAKAFTIDFKARRDFLWFLGSRLLILMALGTVQTYAFFYLRDVVKVSAPAAATSDFVIAAGAGMLVSIYGAARASDRIGRKPVLIASGVLGIAAVTLLLWATDYQVVVASSAMLGISAGSFLSTNWALATDLVPKGEEARYLGLTNVASAGGGALSRLVGPGIDYMNGRSEGLGYTAMLWLVGFYFVAGTGLMIMLRSKTQSAETSSEASTAP